MLGVLNTFPAVTYVALKADKQHIEWNRVSLPPHVLQTPIYAFAPLPMEFSADWNILTRALLTWTEQALCAMLLVTGLKRIPDECVLPARKQDCRPIAGPHWIPFTNTCSECALEARVAEEL